MTVADRGAAPYGRRPRGTRRVGLLTEHALRRGSHNNVKQLRAAIVAYIDAHNDESKPFRWTKIADEILASLARFATRTLTAHPA